MTDEKQTFLFDDFFIPEDDPGVERTVKIQGRDIPISFKRGFSLDDIQAAKTLAVKTKFNLKTQQPEIIGIDEGAFVNEMLFRAIVSWPFQDHKGKKIPVTREAIGQLKAEALQPLTDAMNSLVQEAQQDLNFFENPSGEAS